MKLLPTETGWYWIKMALDLDWQMAWLDESDGVLFVMNVTYRWNKYMVHYDLDTIDVVEDWVGPINNPAEGATVIPDEESRDQAWLNNHAIVIEHIDFSNCRDGETRGKVTTVDVVPRRLQRSMSCHERDQKNYEA